MDDQLYGQGLILMRRCRGSEVGGFGEFGSYSKYDTYYKWEK